MTRKQKWGTALGVVIVAVIAVRALAPGFILRKINAALAEMSPHYSAHIDDLDIHLWRMAYGFEGITVRQKKPDRQILSVREVDVSLAWRELLERRITVDIDVDGADLKVDQPMLELMNDRKVAEKGNAQEAKKTLVPFKIERVRLRDSQVAVRDLPQIPIEEALRITEINATLRNLIPSAKDPQTDFSARAKVMDRSPLRAEGSARLSAKPLRWEGQADLRDFDVRTVNALLSRLVPLSFDRGVVDAYAVVKAVGSNIEGSVQPFARDLEFIGDKRDFKGLKHHLIEIGSAISSWIVENRKEGTIATQVDFKVADGNFSVDVRKAIDEALRHRFREPMEPKRLN
ncbi:MAG: DUF748 domain-containing protein [Bdellovibrionaceae bacterium]|nr:DUF748 domain-containing protein [Pseudobdellovibrionaceae bacterium]